MNASTKPTPLLRHAIERSRRLILSPGTWKRRIVFWLGAILVGAAAALFARMAELAHQGFQTITAISPYLPLLVTPLGLVASLWITRRFFAGAEGSGIPQTIAALSYRDWKQRLRLLSPRIAIGKIAMTTLGLGVGASIGREGPSVHVGASVMYGVGQLAHFSKHDLDRGLILAGGAAGIAAAFNTPLAGIIFAIEEMSRSFEERTSGTLLIAVILAGMTALAINGNYTYFGKTDVSVNLDDWMLIPLCGVIGGLLGGLFSTALVSGTRRIAPVFLRYPYRVAAACGLIVALLGIISDGTSFGTGYAEAKGILTGTSEAGLLYPVYKLFATLASYWSGIPGGIFAPSLATGAGLGADLAPWFPSTPVAAAAVLGMVSYFAGVVQTPITGFVIVMEITGSHAMALPIMAAAFIGYGSSRLVCREPIYRALSVRFAEPADSAGQTADNERPTDNTDPSRG